MLKGGVLLLHEKMPNLLLKRAFLTPDRPAIRFKDREFTFKELYDLAWDRAGRLTESGVKPDQFIGVLLRNHIDTVVILLALQLLGVKAVILNNRLTSEELSWQLKDSGSTILITEDIFHEKVKEIPAIICLTKEELKSAPFKSPEIKEEVSLTDVCTVMYTSGTTGHPKGVLQTYGNHWWSAVGSALNLGLREDDCWLCSVPLFHISGYSILMRSLVYGMKIVLHESFYEKQTIQDIHAEKVTIMSVVTTTLTRLVKELNEDALPSYFRCMLLGGGPAPLPLLEKCVDKVIPVFQSYGMTETASQIVTLSPEYSITKLGSAGKTLFPSQLKIIDDEGNTVEAFQSGEIAVKGPNVTVGYLNREEETQRKMKNGWFQTGDIGYLDDEGFLYVQDRRSDLIISGGENIYPAEIEGVIMSHSQVIDAGVIGKNDDKWGQVPVAFIVREGIISAEEVISLCYQKLAKYKVPKEIYFVDQLPRNASKKLLRRVLRNYLEEK